MKKIATSSIAALLLVFASACAPQGQSDLGLEDDNSSIIGGTTVVPGSPISKQVFMIYMQTIHGGGGVCTATMISPNIGLTAAHCVDQISGALAIFDIAAIDRLMKSGLKAVKNDPRIIPVTRVHVHPSWTGSISRGNNGDIAVFKLARNKPANVEVTQIHTDGLQLGQTLVATGYGVNSGSLSIGSGLLRETRVKVINPNLSATEFSVDQRRAMGVCSGDSGGPSFAISPFGRLKQVGIVSYGQEGCENTGVYTHVAPYSQWILSAMRAML